MRRAMRHGKRLGMTEPFLHTLVDTVVREFGDAYPELRRRPRRRSSASIRSEEERFDAVLTGGLPRLEEVARPRRGRRRCRRRRRGVPAVRHLRPARRTSSKT